MSQIKRPIILQGRGIHSGNPVNITILPAKSGGIVFRRVDMPGDADIVARYDNVGDTKFRNTTIGDVSGAHVQTIEHLMAALFICGVRDAVVEIDNNETPILDGSADKFITAISESADAGGRKMPRIVVRRPVRVTVRDVRKTLPWGMRFKLWLMDLISHRRQDGFVELCPNGGKSLDISATLVYAEKIIGRQSYDYSFDGTARAAARFIKDIARSRTFGKYSEWEYLKAHGMGRGADESNVIALNDAGDGTLNKLYFPDEFVRHKIIDAIGDMFTSGGFVVADVESYKGSHALNNAALKKLFSDAKNYDILD